MLFPLARIDQFGAGNVFAVIGNKIKALGLHQRDGVMRLEQMRAHVDPARAIFQPQPARDEFGKWPGFFFERIHRHGLTTARISSAGRRCTAPTVATDSPLGSVTLSS